MRTDGSEGENSVGGGTGKDLRPRKEQLRSVCERARVELGEPYRDRASESICDAIRIWPTFRSAETVCVYLAMRGEVDLAQLIARTPFVTWAVPRIVGSPERHLVFHAYQPDRLVRHRYGMLEPDPSAPEISLAQADLIIVPGMAFTRDGWRLGYGGGYYDRLLAERPHAPALGICFHALLLDDIPHGPDDIPVDYLVTESSGPIHCDQMA